MTLYIRIIHLRCNLCGRDAEHPLECSLVSCTFSQHAYARGDSLLFLCKIKSTAIVSFRQP